MSAMAPVVLTPALSRAMRSAGGVRAAVARATLVAGSGRAARTPATSPSWLARQGSSRAIQYPAPRSGFEWDKLGFRLATKDTRMVVATCNAGEAWSAPAVEPYGPLALEPAATILNYGQGLFEGLKAFRTETGRIVLFRPHKNAQRMADGCRRLLMPPMPPQAFVEACEMAVRENADWVPPCGEGALYLRPILFGSGADLGVKPSSHYSFVIYACPVGKYFSAGGSGARMRVATDHQRAAPMGVGDIKAVGNYAQCFKAQWDAKGDGFSDVIYLNTDLDTIDEGAAGNFFCVTEDRVVHTPQLGTILPGVTRDSIIQLVRDNKDNDLHLNVGKVSIQTAFKSKEAFLSGTAASVSPIAHIASETQSVDFPAPGPVGQMLLNQLLDVQLERAPDVHNWLHDPFAAKGAGRLDSFAEPSF